MTAECDALRERVARLEAEMRGHWKLDEERFRARDAAAREIAQALRDFKALSNEWRGALSDLATTKVSNEAYDARHSELTGRIGAAEKRLSEMHGISAGVEQTRIRTLGVIAAAGTLIGIVLGLAAFALAR